MIQAGTVSVGSLAVWPTAVLLTDPHLAVVGAGPGTTLESTFARGSGRYSRMHEAAPWATVVRSDLAQGKRGREDRRVGLATVVQVSDLHVTDVQNPMRFEYLDRYNSTGHRPQELLNVQGTAALVGRINALTGGPATGRAVDAVMSTGDNTDNQSGNELEWLLTLLAGGTVHPESGAADDFEGVAASGLDEYWQPDSETTDRYKRLGFPHVPDLVKASTAPFEAPGLAVPWLLTMGNHDVVANGMLENLNYVRDWSTGGRKVFSAHCDATVRLAARLDAVKAGDDVGSLIDTVARAGQTRTVQADERRLPYTGAEFVRLLHEVRFTGAGPVGHGYDLDAGSDRLFYSRRIAPRVVAISLDSTNQAGGIDGSIGRTQRDWLLRALAEAADDYVVVFSHHPSWAFDNTARDPRTPDDDRFDGGQLAAILHDHPQVLAWVNGHSHNNKIRPHWHRDPKRSFWEINSASHVDAPQQARMIEIATNSDGTVSLFTTMIDSDAPARTSYDDLSLSSLASMYRELAHNDPARADRSGAPVDRNTELLLADPLGRVSAV
ncbi:TIGR03767 family metallophosphoesterase [Nocardioides marmorisolisilvae]|nr:TIGR03767 family metallophosphoesterase [Nocardioides marmorisolisilvae]